MFLWYWFLLKGIFECTTVILHFHNFIKKKRKCLFFMHPCWYIWLKLRVIFHFRDIFRYEYDPHLSLFAYFEVPVELHHHNQWNYLSLVEWYCQVRSMQGWCLEYVRGYYPAVSASSASALLTHQMHAQLLWPMRELIIIIIVFVGMWGGRGAWFNIIFWL